MKNRWPQSQFVADHIGAIAAEETSIQVVFLLAANCDFGEIILVRVAKDDGGNIGVAQPAKGVFAQDAFTGNGSETQIAADIGG